MKIRNLIWSNISELPDSQFLDWPGQVIGIIKDNFTVESALGPATIVAGLTNDPWRFTLLN